MPRTAKPWFRKSVGAWYAKIDGKQTFLSRNEKEATRRFHQLKAIPYASPVAADSSTLKSLSFVADKYLSWVAKKRAESTYEWVKPIVNSFQDSFGEDDPVAEHVEPYHVIEWTDEHPEWSATTERGYVSALQRMYRWAKRAKHIKNNPVYDIEKPTAEPREVRLTTEQRDAVRDAISDQEFLDFVRALELTGARPQELRIATAVFVRDDRIVIPKKLAKGKKRARTIYLNDEMQTMVARLHERWPTGSLWRNEDGNAWNNNAVRSRFRRLRAKLDEKNDPPLYSDLTAYAYRHTYISDALERGVDPVTLKDLVGHADLAMISRVYAHLRSEHLATAARKAAG